MRFLLINNACCHKGGVQLKRLESLLKAQNIVALYNEKKFDPKGVYELEYTLNAKSVRKHPVIVCPALKTVFDASMVDDKDFVANLITIIQNNMKYVVK